MTQSSALFTCSHPPCPDLLCPPESTCTSSPQWQACADSHIATLCHPGLQSTDKKTEN